MRYKAVCEELWSIGRDAPDRFLYGETPREAAVLRLQRGADRGRVDCETRRMRDNNKK